MNVVTLKKFISFIYKLENLTKGTFNFQNNLTLTTSIMQLKQLQVQEINIIEIRELAIISYIKVKAKILL